CFGCRTGRFLSPEELQAALNETKAEAVVLGGSGAFRTDGSTQLGVRKLISGLQGLVYDSDWLPSPSRSHMPTQAVPIWLCRRGQDDAALMVVEHVRRWRGASSVAWRVVGTETEAEGLVYRKHILSLCCAAHTTAQQRTMLRGLAEAR
ncbi:hypothetical protein VOLCADRAFT_94187, partial [Volvox carteri f. nagariensis]